jgi:hypothetical protein
VPTPWSEVHEQVALNDLIVLLVEEALEDVRPRHTGAYPSVLAHLKVAPCSERDGQVVTLVGILAHGRRRCQKALVTQFGAHGEGRDEVVPHEGAAREVRDV